MLGTSVSFCQAKYVSLLSIFYDMTDMTTTSTFLSLLLNERLKRIKNNKIIKNNFHLFFTYAYL